MWIDTVAKHKIACIDISKNDSVKKIFGKNKVKLYLQIYPIILLHSLKNGMMILFNGAKNGLF